MANNYLQFSEAFKLDNDAQVEWLEDLFAGMEEAGYDEVVRERLAKLLGVEIDNVMDHVSTLQWALEFNRDGRVLYATSEEGIDVEMVANALQRLLDDTQSDTFYKIEWAETCSKLRCGEFGGGACVISRESIQFESTGSAVQRMIGNVNTKRLRKANAAARRAQRKGA